MNENKDNVVVKKSYAFALEIICLYKFLIEQKEFIISKQLMKSGTSIGQTFMKVFPVNLKKTSFIIKHSC